MITCAGSVGVDFGAGWEVFCSAMGLLGLMG